MSLVAVSSAGTRTRPPQADCRQVSLSIAPSRLDRCDVGHASPKVLLDAPCCRRSRSPLWQQPDCAGGGIRHLL